MQSARNEKCPNQGAQNLFGFYLGALGANIGGIRNRRRGHHDCFRFHLGNLRLIGTDGFDVPAQQPVFHLLIVVVAHLGETLICREDGRIKESERLADCQIFEFAHIFGLFFVYFVVLPLH